MLTDLDTMMMACIHADHPRSSWAGWDRGDGYFGTGEFAVSPQGGVLLQFPLDRIPKGQRIVNAELQVPVHYCGGDGTKLFVWRLLAGWGKGVSHLNRQVRPATNSWSVAGARGPGVDHALAPTRMAKLKGGGENVRLDVTGDVQLWTRGGTPNHGWLITTEDEGSWAYLLPSLAGYRWTLRITYEPE